MIETPTVNNGKVLSGKQLLQIVPVNVITLLTMIVCSVGLYYKFDARIGALETKTSNESVSTRVSALEKKMDENTPRIIRTDTNVLWLMSRQSKTPTEEP